jgi:hypothetical protein
LAPLFTLVRGAFAAEGPLTRPEHRGKVRRTLVSSGSDDVMLNRNEHF